jgi:hypothetical protein
MIGSISLDLDDLWSYQKTHGNPAWVDRPSYLRLAVPRILDELDRLGQPITFFLVGSDAARADHRDLFRMIVDRGHEVANHSFEHDCWLPEYSAAALDAELAKAEAAIEGATGVRPTGFRGPGFSWSGDLLASLQRRGYQYDASTLPTYLGPLARLYFMASSPLTGEERARRKALFGGWREGARPTKPYYWRWDDGRRLLELPVTTIPGLKLPFHLSYLIYLRRFSRLAMRSYLRTAIGACIVTETAPSFLLHPLDFLSGDEVPSLRFFPGMELNLATKLAAARECIAMLGQHFSLGPMGRHALIAATATARAVRPPMGQSASSVDHPATRPTARTEL